MHLGILRKNSCETSQCNESAVITGLTLSMVHPQGLVGVAVVFLHWLKHFCCPANSYLTLTGTRQEAWDAVLSLH